MPNISAGFDGNPYDGRADEFEPASFHGPTSMTSSHPIGVKRHRPDEGLPPPMSRGHPPTFGMLPQEQVPMQQPFKLSPRDRERPGGIGGIGGRFREGGGRGGDYRPQTGRFHPSSPFDDLVEQEMKKLLHEV